LRTTPFQLGILQPDIVRLGDGHRLAHGGAHPVQVGHHLLGREVVAKQHLVAHDHPVDGVGIGARLGDQQLDLALVVVQPLVDLGAGHHLEALGLGQPVDLRVLLHRVRAHAVAVLVQQLEVGGDLVAAGVVLLERALVALEHRQRETADPAMPVVGAVRQVAPPPQADVHRGHDQRERHGGEQRKPAVVLCCDGAQKSPRRMPAQQAMKLGELNQCKASGSIETGRRGQREVRPAGRPAPAAHAGMPAGHYNVGLCPHRGQA